MDRLTRSDIELMCEQAIGLNPRWSRANATALGDLALQSLSQEAVRDEVLEEAAKVCIAMAVREFGRRRFERTDHAMDACADAIRALKREPNAAAQGGLTSHNEDTELSSGPRPAPAAPDVAGMVKRLLAHGNPGASGKGILCEQAAALLAKLGQGWIPVSEKLPGFGITCLFVNDGAIEKGVRAPSGWVVDDDIDGRPTLAVTHWMSLPIVPGASDE